MWRRTSLPVTSAELRPRQDDADLMRLFPKSALAGSGVAIIRVPVKPRLRKCHEAGRMLLELTRASEGGENSISSLVLAASP